MAFKAPSNYKELLRDTSNRLNKLIEFGYIDNIDKGILKSWLDNFETPEEKYFATLILHKLIYRSEKAIISMFNDIVEINLPNLFKKHEIMEIDSISNWKKLLKDPLKSKELNFCISTITGVDDNIGKSGEDLNRLFKEKQIIHKNINKNMSSKNKLPKRLKYIVLIDDIVGTGKQFTKFYNKFKKGKLKHFEKIIYIPMVAYHESIEAIEQLDDKIIVEPLEILNSDKVFITDTNEKVDGVNTLKELNDFYNDFLNKKNITLYNEYSINSLYVFKISSPNTNLPLIYYENDETWNKLFFRF